MRALIISLMAILVLVYTSWAAPCYGTKIPKKGQAAIGLQTHYVFNRYQEHEAGSLRSGQEFLLVSYGVFDTLSLDLKGGAGFIKQHPKDSDELDYPAYLGGGYGFRWIFFKSKDLNAVFGFQHISIHPKTIKINGSKRKAVLDDWQFSLLASYGFKWLTPYLGTKWSRMDYIHWIDGNRDRVKSDLTRSVGVVAGLDINLDNHFWLNLEVQAVDCEAAAISLNYNF